MNKSELLFRWRTNSLIRYLVVGIWNTLFGVILLYTLFFLFNKKYYEYELFTTYVLGTAQSYSTQRLLVWKSSASRQSEFTRFAFASILQYVLNAVMLFFAVHVLKIDVNYAAFPITIIVACLFYFVSRKLVFKIQNKRQQYI